MNTLRQLSILPIWVNPQHLVSTAAHILVGHRVKALGVLEDSTLVGTISLQDIAHAPDHKTVGQFMKSPVRVLEVTTTIREAAHLLAADDLDFLPVKDGSQFVGIVTPNMLLHEMGRSFDPMSGLSWSDQLREWGLRHLEDGDEVTILFIDLNDFGQYNKRHGHVIGDRVIRMVAGKLSECVDPTRDILVRYGGDEFAIGTIRHRDDADTLAELVRTQASGAVVEDGVEPVTFSLGVFGGRRTKERENMHFSATLDNLINMASRAALAAKNEMKRVQARAVVEAAIGPDSGPGEYRVVGVYADDQGLRPVTTVILSLQDTIVSGASPQVGVSKLEAAVQATVRAVERTRPEIGFKFEELATENGSIRLKGRVTRGEDSRAVNVSRPVGDDMNWAIAQATLEALVGE